MRYFRCLAGDETYEQARLTLDAAWGHPNAETNTLTCFNPAENAPRDTQGRAMLAVNDEFVAYPAAAEMLTQLLAIGAVEEITEDAYRAALESPSPVS